MLIMGHMVQDHTYNRVKWSPATATSLPTRFNQQHPIDEIIYTNLCYTSYGTQASVKSTEIWSYGPTSQKSSPPADLHPTTQLLWVTYCFYILSETGQHATYILAYLWCWDVLFLRWHKGKTFKIHFHQNQYQPWNSVNQWSVWFGNII